MLFILSLIDDGDLVAADHVVHLNYPPGLSWNPVDPTYNVKQIINKNTGAHCGVCQSDATGFNLFILAHPADDITMIVSGIDIIQHQ